MSFVLMGVHCVGGAMAGWNLALQELTVASAGAGGASAVMYLKDLINIVLHLCIGSLMGLSIGIAELLDPETDNVFLYG